MPEHTVSRSETELQEPVSGSESGSESPSGSYSGSDSGSYSGSSSGSGSGTGSESGSYTDSDSYTGSESLSASPSRDLGPEPTHHHAQVAGKRGGGAQDGAGLVQWIRGDPKTARAPEPVVPLGSVDQSMGMGAEGVDAARVEVAPAPSSPAILDERTVSATRELVDALNGVARSTDGRSIADLMADIASALRALEVTARASLRQESLRQDSSRQDGSRQESSRQQTWQETPELKRATALDESRQARDAFARPERPEPRSDDRQDRQDRQDRPDRQDRQDRQDRD